MNDALFLKKVGQNIKKIRLAKGLTQVALGHLCETEKTSINRIEAGRTNPTLTTLKNIAEHLDVSVSDLTKID